MAWSVPLTAVSNSTLTAAQWNASVRDNLLETAPAKATAGGQFFVATAANAIAARAVTSASLATVDTTASLTFTGTLTSTSGPAVTVTTGTSALVGVVSTMSNGATGVKSLVGFAVSGMTTVAAADVTAISYTQQTAGQNLRYGAVHHVTGLTAGSNTFTMNYRVTANTGTFDGRHIWVMPF